MVIVAAAALAGTLISGNTPLLGLDLQGGFSVVLSAKGNPPSDSVEKAKDIIRQRIDGLGVAEPEVTRQGKTVVVQLPGVKDRKKAQSIVGQTAKLEFRPVVETPATGYRYDAALAKVGKNPCTTAPATSSTTTTTGPSSSTTPSSTTAPTTAATGTGTTESGAPAIGPAEGESAAGALPSQATTGTTAPAASSTTAATTATSAPSTTTTTAPASGGTEVVPTDAKSDQPGTCLKLGAVGFEGTDLSRSKAEVNTSTGEWLVSVSIKGKSKTKANTLMNSCFNGEATCATKQLAIVLDNRVQSFPTVQSANLASEPNFEITGNFTSGEAKDLALVLRYGALPVEFERSAEQQVSATLGKDSLRAGLVAGLVGLALVALYMLLYYRGLAMVVLLGLGVWGSLMYSVICFLSARSGLALSLAGVTGIIVSVGTTVDSYVVYFERLKDEVRTGKTLRGSAERGFDHAFRTILTADVSSFIGAFLLWWLTVGPVRGFAFFLGLSVVLDVVVAYLFTRPLVVLLGRNQFFTSSRFIGLDRGLGARPGANATPVAKGAAAAGAGGMR